MCCCVKSMALPTTNASSVRMTGDGLNEQLIIAAGSGSGRWLQRQRRGLHDRLCCGQDSRHIQSGRLEALLRACQAAAGGHERVAHWLRATGPDGERVGDGCGQLQRHDQRRLLCQLRDGRSVAGIARVHVAPLALLLSCDPACRQRLRHVEQRAAFRAGQRVVGNVLPLADDARGCRLPPAVFSEHERGHQMRGCGPPRCGLRARGLSQTERG
jgi:hypothetical protein